MKISKNGLDLIKSYEKFSPTPYHCPAGKLTIGYGHVIKENESFNKITEQRACEILDDDCDIAENCINKNATAPLTQNQFDALTSFVFNIGINAFRNSTLLLMLNNLNYQGAADQLLRWNKCGGIVLNGLSLRRMAERSLFLNHEEI